MPVDSLIVMLSTKTGNSTVFRRHSWAYRLSVVYIVVYNQSSISQMWRRGGSWQRCSYPSRNIFQMLAKWSAKRHGFSHRYASEILRISCTPFFKGMEWKHSHQHHQRRHTNRRNHLMYHPNHRIFLLFVVIIISVPIHAWTLAHFVSLFNVELDTNNQYNELTFPYCIGEGGIVLRKFYPYLKLAFDLWQSIQLVFHVKIFQVNIKRSTLTFSRNNGNWLF